MDKWLVEGWREAHRWLSVQFAFLLGLLQVAYEYAPQIADFIPDRYKHLVSALLVMGVIVGRVVKQ